ncbi:MAG: HAD superfamily phosphoserine phosphatase-like hydrolase [Saprospiraceae bacterium]|jgi:HAD superfamily phosphoserine phosphatase-like hydrolase
MQANLFFDFDSTVCRLESLDQALFDALKNHPGKSQLEAQINGITDSAMSGEIDLCESILARLELIPLTKSQIDVTAKNLASKLTLGIDKLIQELLTDGHNVHLISGGFDDFIAPSSAQLGLPSTHFHANQFVFEGEQVVGINTANSLTRSDGKAEVIALVANPDYPIIMIGDGYNDLKVYLQDACDHFIGFGGNVRRANIERQSPLYANSVAALRTLLDTLLKPQPSLT